MEKGRQHEKACLKEYRRNHGDVLSIEPRNQRTFAQWVADVGNPFAENPAVVYQMPLIHDGMRGIADFVIRVTDPQTGQVCYEPVDAKLTRTEAKPGHVLQLCFYADAIAELTGSNPRNVHLWLGSGQMESLRVNDFQPYWRRLRKTLDRDLAAGPRADTIPQPCAYCDYCEFKMNCEAQWRLEDSLIYVAGIRRREIETLARTGVTTLSHLGQLNQLHRPIEDLREERLSRLSEQARLQKLAAEQDSMPFSIVESADEDTAWGLGLQKLPMPDDGDVFIDFEGHPLWQPQTGLLFLLGLLERATTGWIYKAWWAHSKEQEGAAGRELIQYIANRRDQFPLMHAYHYNHTERSALQGLADGHPEAESQLGNLIDTGALVDLYEVGLNGIQIGAESYGLKCMEKLTDYQRSHEIDKGAGAVLKYEHYLIHGDDDDLKAIARYNEDDVRATLALRDWLVDNRPPNIGWRAAYLQPEDKDQQLDDTVIRLHARGGEWHFLGDLLGYWRRERRAYFGPKLAKLAGDAEDQLLDPEIIGELSFVGGFERRHKTADKAITPGKRFSFPPQQLDEFSSSGGAVLFSSQEQKVYTCRIARLDRSANELELVWDQASMDAVTLPDAVAHHDFVEASPKPDTLREFAEVSLQDQFPDNVTTALFRRELPRFTDADLRNVSFATDLSHLSHLVSRLDRSYLAIQGPPGTGKTHTAAHVIHSLIKGGSRVGIAAVSHPAINNLLQQVVDVFLSAGDIDKLSCIRQRSGSESLPPDVKDLLKLGNNRSCADSKYKLVAGTTWVFASAEMRASPVDILVIDEAGQMSLADTLAASTSASNLLLVGDPLQLPQVTQASHPGKSGQSVLEHVLGEDKTMPPDRGIFLAESRRMHPDICRFISEQIYEGRLASHPKCARQSTAFGTGLRWIPAVHSGNTTSSTEEAEIVVAEIRRLLGTEWTDQDGEKRILEESDFIVVTPYNDQRRVLQGHLRADPHTSRVVVGTVDKFQGQESAVVFFSMATSSGDEVVHGKEFLFSRNRLNVAISRARCLAYLVCTESLLDTRAKSTDEMRLISTLNAFVEWSKPDQRSTQKSG